MIPDEDVYFGHDSRCGAQVLECSLNFSIMMIFSSCKTSSRYTLDQVEYTTILTLLVKKDPAFPAGKT